MTSFQTIEQVVILQVFALSLVKLVLVSVRAQKRTGFYFSVFCIP